MTRAIHAAGIAVMWALAASLLEAAPPDRSAEQIGPAAKAIASAWDGVLRQIPARARSMKLPPPMLTDVTLKKALAGSNLRLQLIEWNDRFVAGRAWVDGSDHVPRCVRIVEEKAAGNGTQLRLIVHLPGASVDKPGPLETARFELKLKGKSGPISGTFNMPAVELKPLPIPASKGTVQGARTPLAKARPAPPRLAAPKSLQGAAGANAAVKLWNDAMNLLRLYRSLDVAMAHKTTAAETWEAGRMLLPAALTEKEDSPGAKPKIPTAIEEDDDLGLGLDDDEGLDEDVPAKAAAKPVDPATQKKLITMAGVLAHARAGAEKWAAASGSPPVAPGAKELAADPDFGPWYGFGALKVNKAGANLLPADAGGQGSPNWLAVSNWQITGPFPVKRRELFSWHLPEFFDVTDGGYLTNTNAMRSHKQTIMPKTQLVSWQDMPAYPEEGLQRPWTTPPDRGSKYFGPFECRSYARAVIRSARAKDLWVAVGADDECRLWVNGEPAAASIGQPGAAGRMAMGRVSFRAGENVLMLRCDNVADPARRGRQRTTERSHFWVKVAVRGAPHHAAAVKAREALLAAHKTKPSTRPPPRTGYRNNATGFYPDARPVTAWNLKTGDNILWRLHLGLEGWGKNYYRSQQSSSKAPPIVVGDRLILLKEPHFVLCLDKKTGKKLWERECSVLELTAPDKLARAQELWKRLADARAALMALGSSGEEREATLTKRGLDPEAVQEKLKELGAAYGKWAGVGKKGDTQETFWKLMHAHAEIGKPNWGSWTGYSYASPVSDGKHVWVKFATGVAACFDLEGKRRWMVKIPAEGGYVVCHAPILVGDLFVVSVGANSEMTKKKMGHDLEYARLIGLDAATGEERWRSKPWLQPSATASPVPVRATDGHEDVDLIVTATGALIRSTDGKLMAQPYSVGSGWATPTVDGADVYHGGALTAHRAVMVDRDCIGLQRLWQAAASGGDGGFAFAEGLLHSGAGGQGPGAYEVVDTREGKVLRSERVDQGRQVWRGIPPLVNGRLYVPTIAAGDYVFLGQHGSAFSGRIGPGAICGVMQRRWDGMMVGHSIVERTWTAPPVFDGDRYYIRTDPALICVGYTGDKGRAYEADVNAWYMLGDLETGPLSDAKPIDIVPIKLARLPKGAEFQRYMSYPVTVYGHFSIRNAAAVLNVVSNPSILNTDQRDKWPQEIAGEHVARWSHSHAGMYGHSGQGESAHFKGVEFGRGAYFQTVFVTDRERVVRVWASHEPPDIWICGRKVPEGARVRLRPGTYSCLARVYNTKEWPAPPGFCFHFEDAADPAAEREAWQASLRGCRPELERIAKYATRPAHVARAKKLLAEL